MVVTNMRTSGKAHLFGGVLLSLALTHTASAHLSSAYSHDTGITHTQSDWMRGVAGHRRLKDLSLPGTHDTMAYNVSFPLADIAQTQTMPLATQLAAGVRVLDIRCRRIDNKFTMHHGAVYLHANFDDVLQTVARFLQQHPGETVLMRIKEEHEPANSSMSFPEIFDTYANDPRYSGYFWKSNDPNPTLNDVRGKIVVLANFAGARFGIAYGALAIQDNYHLSTNWALYDKWLAVKHHLLAANASDESVRAFHMNYLSGSGGAFPYFVASGHSSPGTGASRLATGLTTPGWNSSYPDFPRVSCFIGICTIAFEGTNVLTSALIDAARLNFVGTVMADFPGQGLIDKIIALNTGVTLFSHADYAGRPQSLRPGSYDIASLAIGNDTLSSLSVPPGMSVTLFEHAGFQGRSRTVRGDTPFLADFNDTMSSLVVTQEPAVAVFEHNGYAGRTQHFGEGRYDIGALGIGNDVVSSVVVLPGWKVTLFEHAGFQGRSRVVTSDATGLPDFNDLASSLVVERQ
ncbi:phosphatidylinositol-specific phospholipase C domain-containing protein [Tahibacter amnicola]|uniref:1-phosphatidylinositol phosphodiesterase n=1 Tax=Tahibacter amnicola TaxID=2976241 RepID=A0ABY6BL35_9GAMM|nr:phosphatidylinositol-specific phospholipase C domain-containing protein [Tahibacter amnicola]UXI70138.1 phosphatidylinositol-specific phospholipase C domain-containing protein [Tahibacter amnicola]